MSDEVEDTLARSRIETALLRLGPTVNGTFTPTAHALIGNSVHSDVQDDLAERFTELVASDERTLSAFDGATDGIYRSTDLTPNGKKNQTTALRDKMEAALRVAHASFDDTIAKALKATGFVVPPVFPLHGEYADSEQVTTRRDDAKEIREYLRGLADEGRLNLLVDSAERGHKPTFAALDHDPLATISPVVPADFYQRARVLLVASQNTDGYRRSQAIQAIASDAKFNLQRSLRAIGALPDAQRLPNDAA